MKKNTQPSPFYSTVALASYLEVGVSTVRRWQLLGTGPEFVRAGRQIRYFREAVEKWLLTSRRKRAA
jgi:DNA-binding transcriptional MerR regulator